MKITKLRHPLHPFGGWIKIREQFQAPSLARVLQPAASIGRVSEPQAATLGRVSQPPSPSLRRW